MGIGAAEELLQVSCDCDEPGFGDHELAGQIHQVIEPVAVHANRLGNLGLASAGGRLGAVGPHADTLHGRRQSSCDNRSWPSRRGQKRRLTGISNR